MFLLIHDKKLRIKDKLKITRCSCIYLIKAGEPAGRNVFWKEFINYQSNKEECVMCMKKMLLTLLDIFLWIFYKCIFKVYLAQASQVFQRCQDFLSTSSSSNLCHIFMALFSILFIWTNWYTCTCSHLNRLRSKDHWCISYTCLRSRFKTR